MKMVVGLLSLALSFATVASSTDTKTFTYDGSVNSAELLLKGEKTHTEYRTEVQTTTCYRTEIVGYTTVCNGGYYGGGYPYPGPGPYPRPGYGGGYRSCYQQPVYRQVAYPCQQTVQIPFEVKDFDVDARVLIDVTKLSQEMTAGEKFTVTLTGDNLSIQAAGSSKFFLMLKRQSVRSSMNGNVKFMDALYAIDMIEAAPILKSLQMSEVSLNNSVLSFGLGPINNRENIAFSLNVEKRKFLAKDVTLFNRELSSNEVVINDNNTGAAAEVNIEKLGLNLEHGKYAFTAKAFFKAEGTLMNRSQFGEGLETSKKLKYKVKK
jgi:hypothetical protein